MLCRPRRLDVIGFGCPDKAFLRSVLSSNCCWFIPAIGNKGAATALRSSISKKDRPSEKLFTPTNQSNMPMQALAERSLGFVKRLIDNLDEGDLEIIYILSGLKSGWVK